MTVGERIKQKRIEKGMSVEELAAKLGKNRATVYRYESNEIENLPISILPPIATALGVSPVYLMGWEDDQPEVEKAMKLYDQYKKAIPQVQNAVETLLKPPQSDP